MGENKMSEEKIEGETYSLIFKSLKHPLRRKILRILTDRQLSFTEILNIVQIDSGHLSYHLENLSELIKHSANGKYELSSIGKAAVNLMSGVEERPQKSTLTVKFKGKKITKVLHGAVLTIVIVLAALNIYYYNISQALTGKVQGATLETARGFFFSLSYATTILQSEPKPENVFSLIRYFKYHIQSAIEYIRALRMYLLPSSYGDSLLVIEDLLWNITLGGAGGVTDTFDRLGWNVSMVIDAFKELNFIASEKIFNMGHEVAEAFDGLRRDHTVVSFSIISSRLENAGSIANNLKAVLNEWITKYSKM